MRFKAQNHPGKDSKPAHWKALENKKEGIHFGLLIVFLYILQLFLLKKSWPFMLHQSNEVKDKQL